MFPLRLTVTDHKAHRPLPSIESLFFHFLCLFWQSALLSDLGTLDNFSLVGSK